MLFTGWEVRIVKNCDRRVENAARGRHIQGRKSVHYGVKNSANTQTTIDKTTAIKL